MHLCLIIIFGKVSGGMIYGCHMGILGNIYASNFSTQNKSLFLNFEDQIEKTVELYSNAKLVGGGDFNTIWDSENDCLPPRPGPGPNNIIIYVLPLT